MTNPAQQAIQEVLRYLVQSGRLPMKECNVMYNHSTCQYDIAVRYTVTDRELAAMSNGQFDPREVYGKSNAEKLLEERLENERKRRELHEMKIRWEKEVMSDFALPDSLFNQQKQAPMSKAPTAPKKQRVLSGLSGK